MRAALVSVFVLVLATAGCRAAPQASAPPVAVTLLVVPADGGSAGFEVGRDGAIRGWHLSGYSIPFVHQDEGRLDSVVIDSLWALAATLDSATANAAPPTGKGYAALQLTFAEGTPWVTSWPDSTEAAEPRVRSTARWLLAHRIGGW